MRRSLAVVFCVVVVACCRSGFSSEQPVLIESWTGIPGTEVESLTSHDNYPDNPDEARRQKSFDFAGVHANSYGTRSTALLIPKVTGEYTFWLATDDSGELWLGKDGTARSAELVASVSGFAHRDQWEKMPSQKSAPIHLEAGKEYFLRALQKDGGGADNMAVAWSGPGIERTIIGGEYLFEMTTVSPKVMRLLKETRLKNRERRMRRRKDHTARTLRFGVVADVQWNANTAQLSSSMLDHGLHLVLYPGDIVNYGPFGKPGAEGNDSWDEFTDKTVGVFAAAGQNIDLYMVPGNHDMGGSYPMDPMPQNSDWQNQFDTYPGDYPGTYYDNRPWLPDSQTVDGAYGPQTGVDQMDYYVDYGNTRFISITTDRDNLMGYTLVNMKWFENVLNHPDTLRKDHVFIMTHHPVTYTGYENAEGTFGPFWHAMVNSGAKVHGIFVGHWHQYQPGQPDPHNPDLWEVNVGTGTCAPIPRFGHGHPWQNRSGFAVIDVDGAEVSAEFYMDSSGDDGPYGVLGDRFVMHSATPRPTGLVAEYVFSNESSNLDTAPSGPSGGGHPLLGKENHGLYHNGASVSGGKLVLDGIDDYASGYGIGDYNMCILRDLTISIKVRVGSLSNDVDGNTLLSHSSNMGYATESSEVVNQPYNLRIRNDKKLAMMWERDHGVKKEFVSTVAAAALDDGSEHEIRVVRDADAGEVQFFVDGLQLGAARTFDKLTELPTGGQQGHIRIGANFYDAHADGYHNGYVSGFFHGTIDDVRLWNFREIARE